MTKEQLDRGYELHSEIERLKKLLRECPSDKAADVRVNGWRLGGEFIVLGIWLEVYKARISARLKELEELFEVMPATLPTCNDHEKL
jgi:hypothetical protein